MADEPNPATAADELDDELDAEPPEEGAAEGDEPDATPEAEDTATEGEGDDAEHVEGDDAEEPPRAARGVPDRTQRDRRVRREDRLQRQIEDLQRQLGEGGRRLDELSRPRVDPEAQRRAEEAEMERARLEGPEAVASLIAQRTERRVQGMLNQGMRTSSDIADRANFRAEIASSPALAAVAEEVEREHQRLLAADPNYRPNRMVIADLLIGRRARERAGRVGGQQRRRAAEDVRRQTVRAPGNTGSTVSGSRRRPRNFSELSVDEMEAELSKHTVRTT